MIKIHLDHDLMFDPTEVLLVLAKDTLLDEQLEQQTDSEH